LISIIVLAHNQIEMTRRTLESVCQSDFRDDWELLCIDNGSIESFDPLFEQFCAHSIRFRLLRNSENLSFSEANNRAALAANGNRLIFLNNDLVVSPSALRKLMDVLEKEPNAGITGAKLLFPDNGLVQHAGIAQMLWGYASNYGVGADCNHPAIQQQREMFAVTGALMAIDRKLFNRIGGFDERYRYGYEDVDICLKAWLAERKVIYVPEAIGYHHESSSLKSKRHSYSNEHNYRIFRNRWSEWLEPLEKDYLKRMSQQGIRKAVIFGIGQAARGLFHILSKNGVEVVAFTSTNGSSANPQLADLPVVSLEELRYLEFDRLIVGSQYYFQVQPVLECFDPQGSPLFPVIGELPFRNNRYHC
jgi:O-antigen biosynthesis protein